MKINMKGVNSENSNRELYLPAGDRQRVSDCILEAIKNGKIKMQPKWHYVLKTWLMAIGAVILLLVILYFASFIIFILHRTGVWFVPVFGFRGWQIFLFSLPWLLIFLTLIFIIILEILVKRYAFTYRYPLLYSALCLMVFFVIGGFIVAQTPLHGKLSLYLEKNKLPLAGNLYRTFGQQQNKEIHLGRINEINRNGFSINNRNGEIFNIIIASSTYFLYGNNFSKGEMVLIFGDLEDHFIQPLGIRKIRE